MKNNLQNYLQKTLHTCKIAFLVVVVFSIFVNLLVLTIPLYMMQIFDRVLTSGSMDTLLFLTVIAVIAIAIYSCLEIARSFILNKVSHWLDKQLSGKALLPSARLSFQGNSYGVQCLGDVNSLRHFLGGQAIYAFLDAPWSLIFIVVLFFLHPAFALVTLIGGGVLFFLAFLNEKLTTKTLQQANALSQSNNRKLEIASRNADVIEGMGLMPSLVTRWEREQEQVLQLQSKASHLGGILIYCSKGIRMLLQISVYAFGAYLIVKGSISPGAMIAASIIMARALAPIEQSMMGWKAFVGARSAYERLSEHFEPQNHEAATVMPLGKPKGAISLEQVNHAYQANEDFNLKQINFSISSGDFIGIVGPTAVGKSTLLRIILGIIEPSMGVVRIDNADVKSLSREDIGEHIGYVPQNIELFPGTIAENIARMGELDKEKVLAACESAHIKEMILKMPEGFDTVIGLDTYRLSGGQQQRIALARALYGDPSIIVLDEPNSNMDHEGEMALMSTLKCAKEQGKTIVMVVHRKNILDLADRIMVIHEGKIQCFGPKNEVLTFMEQQQAFVRKGYGR